MSLKNIGELSLVGGRLRRRWMRRLARVNDEEDLGRECAG